jgi:uncharacterized membrane protein
VSEIEQAFVNVASTIRLIAEISSVIIIAIGIGVAIYLTIQTLIFKQKIKYTRLRLLFGKFLVLALEFQLAADIVGTAIAPSLDQITSLAAIALIRTFLNYFLNREIKSEEKDAKDEITNKIQK